MAIALEEQYWDDILMAPLPNYPNLTIRDMVNAWRIFSSLGRVVKSRVPSDTGVARIAKLIQFAPKFKKNELVSAIVKATKFTYQQALSIINLCTFNGNVKDDLWIKPIIPLENGNLCVLIPSLIITNRIRLIESWMKEGGIDLDKRGFAFEDYIRQEVNKCIKKSKHLSDTFVSPKSVRLVINGQEEEMDFIWAFGSLLIIGEIKCSLFPTSPLEYYNFSRLLDFASQQVKRKAKFVKENLFNLCQILQVDMPKSEKDIEIIPIVITNLPYGSGFPINNVPITDLRILIRYIEGYQKFFVSTKSQGDEDSTMVTFYSSKEEAQNNIFSFLSTPPTIRLFIEQLKSEIEPIWKFENREKQSGWLRLFVDESMIMDDTNKA